MNLKALILFLRATFGNKTMLLDETLIIGLTNVFSALTFDRSLGRCYKPRAKPEIFDLSPRDLANVNVQ